MKLSLLTLIVGSVFVDKTSAQPQQTCVDEFGTSCKTCDQNTEPWVAECSMLVKMKCTYMDGGVEKSCYSPGRVQMEVNPPPTWIITQEECDARPEAFEYPATITYTMCNVNDLDFTPRPAFLDSNYIRYVQTRNLDPSTDVSPADWDATTPARNCKNLTIQDTFTPCTALTRGISISMDGLLDKDYPNYCRCFLREWIVSDITPPDDSSAPSKNPTKSPTKNPTNNPTFLPTKNPTGGPTPAPIVGPTFHPTAHPTFNPTADPTGGPTKYPTKSPTDSPTAYPTMACDLSNVIITEIASPQEAYAKYIELLFLDAKCKGVTITAPLKIIRFADGECAPSSITVDLTGVTIRDDGFVTVCNSINAELYYGYGSCTVVGGLTSPANLQGTETIAVVMGDLINFSLIDIFGIPCQTADQSKSNITNGRAVRKIPNWAPVSPFDYTIWHVFPGDCGQEVGPEGMDINLWKEEVGPVCDRPTLLITEIVDLDVNSVTTVPRFVEIHAPRKRDQGRGFNFDLKLVIFHGDFLEPNWDSAIPITYMPEDGFLVVCNPAAKAAYGDKCDVVSTDIAGPANSNGNDQIAIISGDADGWFVIDIYGVIGEDGYDTDHDFLNSRVVRKIDVTETQATWSKDDWTLCASDFPDPGQWNSDVCGGGVETPSSLPTSAPTYEFQKDCQFFFTELADVDNKPFIEIKSTCPGITISRPLTVVGYKEYGQTCEVDLQGVTVPDDGFIIICPSKIQHETNYGGYINDNGMWRDVSTCDIESTIMFAGIGYNSYALVDTDSGCNGGDDGCVGSGCSTGCNDKYLDIYGYPGVSLEDTPHEYEGCRVARKIDYPFGLSSFDSDVYEIVCDITSIVPQPGMKSDPRQWVEIPLILVLSEFCDPMEDKNKRFIELYSPNKKDYKISDDLILMKWEGTSPNPSYVYRPLKGLTINEDGFLVLCVNWYFWGSDTCDVSTGYNSIVSMDGSEHYAIAECEHPSEGCDPIDTFGVPGADATLTGQVFTDGRAWRIPESTLSPSKIYDKREWVIKPSVSSDKCDPGSFPPPSPPTLPPAPSPPKPSKGYSNPSKGKSKRLRK